MFDDDEPLRPKPAMRRALDGLGVAELEAYVAELRAEIARAEAEADRKRAMRSAASSVFKTEP